MLRFLVFVLLLGAMLIAQAPAWLVAHRIASDTAGWLELRAPIGTVWNGSAEAIVPPSLPTGASISLGRVAWRLAAIDWRSAATVVEIEQTPPAPRPIRLTGGSDRTMLAGVLRAPAAVVTRLPQLSGWSVAGTLLIDAPSLAWSHGQPIGTATIRWHNAAIGPSNLPEPVSLGDVTASAAFDAQGLALSFSNAGGSVQLTGAGDSRTGRVDVQLQPRPEASVAQTAWLRSMGPAAASGAGGGYAFSFTLPGRR